MIKKTYSANFENLDAMREIVGEYAKKWGFDERGCYNLQLAIDEAATNIIEHSYENQADKTIELHIEKQQRAIVLTLIDSGPQFRPTVIPTPSSTPDLETTEIGGLGLYFIHKLMDEVTYEYTEGIGNILRMLKRLPEPEKKKPRSKHGFQEIFELGKRLIDSTTLLDRKERILATIEAQLPGKAEVWLDETRLRLPDQVEAVFAAEPESHLAKKALKLARSVRFQNGNAVAIALPIENEGMLLGVIEVERATTQRFTRRETETLLGIAQTISIAFVAWHQLDIERFRLRQLALVRSVSNQITNEPDIEELLKKVTRLIHSTFKYYYVGIFTYEGGEFLSFKGGMGGSTRTKGYVQEIPIRVKYGAGIVGTAAADGEIKYADNVLVDDLYIPLEVLPETRSELALPLKLDEKVLGVLDLQSEMVDAFHPNDRIVLQALADSIAKAIEGSLLFSELKAQAQQLSLIGEVSRQVTTILHLPDLMQQVADLLKQHFSYPYIHLFTVHPTRRQIVYEAGSGQRSAAMHGYVIDLDEPEGIIPWVARSGKTSLLADAQQDPRYVASPLSPFNTQSEITVPLIYNGEVNGILDIQSDQLGAFTPQDQTLLETLSDPIAAAIRNADLYRSEQWRRQSGESLREVAVLLSANASLEQVMESILTELERNLPADYSSIWLLDETELRCAASHNVDTNMLEKIRDANPESMGVVQTSMRSRKPIIRKKEDPVGPSAIYGGFTDNHSAIYVPLRIGEQAVGVLSLVHHTAGRYGHEAAAMVTTFASYASVAIENARLYDSAQEQAYASAALLQVAQAVVSLTSITEILTTISRILPILVGVQRVVIFQRGSDGKHMPVEHYGIPEEHLAQFWRGYDLGEFSMLDLAVYEENMVLSDQAYLGVEQWTTVQVCDADAVQTVVNSDDRLLVAIPLMMKGEHFGVLLVEEANGGRRFRSRRFEILNGVAQQITLALQNEIYQLEKASRERLELEVGVARQIQETFIPKQVRLPVGWSIATTWKTATQMGGDLYDVLPLADGRIGLFMADVADKGIPAALFMALTRSLLHAAAQLFNRPAQVMNWVNEKLYPDCEQGMFVTAIFGILDCESGEFRYTNAGHNPPIWFNGVQPSTLIRTGIALGVLENADYQQKSIFLSPADVLCFYTDGVTESFSPARVAFGENGLLAVLQQSLDGSPETILGDVLAAVDRFTVGAPLSDDISLMVLRRDQLEGVE